MAAKRRRVFNTLPSPYYCYYNKYNKTQGKKPCIQQQTMRTLWGKKIRSLPAADCGPKAAKETAEKSEKLTRLRVCGFASRTRETAGAARTASPLPRPCGTRSGPSPLWSGNKASRRALPADAAWPIHEPPRSTETVLDASHKNWKSSGTGWKMRPAKMEIWPGLSANFQPGSRHRKHPQKLPGDGKRPFCCAYKYSK